MAVHRKAAQEPEEESVPAMQSPAGGRAAATARPAGARVLLIHGAKAQRRGRPALGVRTAAAAVTAALLVAGCGAGTNATTTLINSPGVGVTEYADRIRILNALVFPAAPPVRPETVLSVGIANDWSESDRLTGIEVTGPSGGTTNARVEVVGPRDIPAEGMLLLTAAASPTVAYLCGDTLRPDPTVSLTFRFAYADPVTVTTVIAPLGSYWETGGLVIPPTPLRPGFVPCAGQPAATVSPIGG